MYCTICKIDVNTLTHYRSNLHSINARRKIYGYPPVMLHELDTESLSDDLSIDLNLSREDSSVENDIYGDAVNQQTSIESQPCPACAINRAGEVLQPATNHSTESGVGEYCSHCQKSLNPVKVSTNQKKTEELLHAENTLPETSGNSIIGLDSSLNSNEPE